MWARAPQIKQAFRNPVKLVASAWLASFCIAGLITLVMGVPVPRVHDEFAYLLGADTYASGRLTNPTHPLWQHFESFHVLSQPSYMPKYPPAQSLLLALGKIIVSAHMGVCLSTALASAGLVWMLIGWLPKRYWWLVWCVAVLNPALQLKWGHSYMGGAIAFFGACLLLGALIRSLRRVRVSWSMAASVGILILAISRPFEGFVLTVCVTIALLLKVVPPAIQVSGQWKQLVTKLIVPVGAILICGGAWMLYNNHRVTGSVSTLPYQLYESQYGQTPLFLWQRAKANPPAYNHVIFEKYYSGEDREIQEKFGSLASTVVEKSKALLDVVHLFCSGCEFLIVLALPFLLTHKRTRIALLIAAPTLFAAAATPWTLTHYAAPVAPLLIALTLAGLIAMLEWLRRRSMVTIQYGLLGFTIALFSSHCWTLARRDYQANEIPWALRRQQMQVELSQQPGKDLVVVRYSERHNPHEEWVYNQADIDQAEVVWARSISPESDQRLIEYFANHKLHYLDVD